MDRDALEQAISNTCIRDGFTVKRCNTPKECVEFLAEMTEAITGTKTLRIISPSYFNPSIIMSQDPSVFSYFQLNIVVSG